MRWPGGPNAPYLGVPFAYEALRLLGASPSPDWSLASGSVEAAVVTCGIMTSNSFIQRADNGAARAQPLPAGRLSSAKQQRVFVSPRACVVYLYELVAVVGGGCFTAGSSLLCCLLLCSLAVIEKLGRLLLS